jgi:TatA/E family protein of Tat protein translocase
VHAEDGGPTSVPGETDVIGTQDLLVFLALGLFFFGARRLPEVSRSLGQALTEFKKGVNSPAEPETPPPVTRTPASRAGSSNPPAEKAVER